MDYRHQRVLSFVACIGVLAAFPAKLPAQATSALSGKAHTILGNEPIVIDPDRAYPTVQTPQDRRFMRRRTQATLLLPNLRILQTGSFGFHRATIPSRSFFTAPAFTSPIPSMVFPIACCRWRENVPPCLSH